MCLGPNPATDATTIYWQGTESLPLSVTVYDLSGRVLQIMNLDQSERTLSLAEYPSGTYLIDARVSGNIRQTARLVILAE
jgi:hypothetical protein